MTAIDIIEPDSAATLSGLFAQRCQRTPSGFAYRYCGADDAWTDLAWKDMERRVAHWQQALQREALKAGDRVAMMLRNCPDWVAFDQAALGLGLVTVPLYTEDRGGNVGFVLEDSGCRLLLIGGDEQWQEIAPAVALLEGLKRVVSIRPLAAGTDARVAVAEDWLGEDDGSPLQVFDGPGESLASIVYTSGTTGRPKGVMLSHWAMLWNARAALYVAELRTDDLMLSFLPLSHTFERTIGYYAAMMAGTPVAYARSIEQLAEDLVSQAPTFLASVPRIYERVYGRIMGQLADKPAIARWLFNTAVSIGWQRFEHRQGRAAWHPIELAWPLFEHLVARKVMARLGGRLRLAVSGGAPLAPEIARLFIGLGLELSQGYGLTEHAPVVSANPLDRNDPRSVGVPLKGVEVRIGERDEILVRSPSLMSGYWNHPEETARVMRDGWLLTGDQGRLVGEHLYITGRIKDILVLANGEKVSPADMELAIALDPAIEQVMVVGEGRPFVGALVVLDPEAWQRALREANVADQDPAGEAAQQFLVERINARLQDFPSYCQVRRVAVINTPWTIANGMLTPTMKIKRPKILERDAPSVEMIYAGH